MTTLPLSITSGRFLGGSRGGCVCVAGSGARGRASAQVLLLDEEEGEGKKEDGTTPKFSFTSVGSVTLPGHCTAMELCGLSNAAKSFMALATCSQHAPGTLKSVVEVVLVDATVGGGGGSGLVEPMLLPHASAFRDDSDEASAFDALAFDGYSGRLACADATGFVRILDLTARREVSSFVVPGGGGRSSLLYSKSGKLYTAGSSPRGHIGVWDARTSSGRSDGAVVHQSALSVVLPELLALGGPGGAAGHISSMCAHDTQEEVLYCGLSSGSVVQVDLRMGRSVQTVASHTGSRVTSVVHCSVDSGSASQLLSGSDAGDVLCSDLRRGGGQQQHKEAHPPPPLPLLRGGLGNGAITSLDFAAEARCGLACSAAGGLWTFSLARQSANVFLSLP